ncbi:CoA-binding protein [candidate division KSB1 bacterium]
MAIIVDENKRVMVQGITGREGKARTKLMVEYGTHVVAGCTPGKGGMEVEGIPVFNTAEEARENVGDIDISVIFVPAPLVKNAAIEAMCAGVKMVVLIPDRVPIYDVLEIEQTARETEARFVGPNTLGVLSVDRAVLGMIGGRASAAKSWFKKGNVGVTSRSGGITSSIGYYLSKAGVGLTSLVHVGGDVVVGLPHPEIIKLYEEDEETKAVVMFGEIGSSQEETVADLIEEGKFTKPLITFIGGKAAKKGTRFSHAGAIIEGDRGTHEGKVKRLREVGATVVDSFDDLWETTKEIVDRL